MTDIDFDELDRAVSSAIGPDSGTKKATEPSDTVPVSISTAPAPTTTPLAERRSSGRFMDVVHPSSDMRSSSSVPARPVKHEEFTINSSQTPEPSESNESINTTPDPIEDTEITNKSDQTLDEESSKEPNAPLESPFLSNAKVEKRPLGAFSNEVHVNEPTPPVDSSNPSDNVDSEPSMIEPAKINDQTDNPDADTPMPAELQPGLLSIEANEDSEPAKKDAPTPAPEIAEPVGPTSITQQYTPQPSTGDKPVESVFDTDAYKQPQPHTSKKKTGWLVVVWILTLLIVGAGIGAAVYFFVLPRL